MAKVKGLVIHGTHADGMGAGMDRGGVGIVQRGPAVILPAIGQGIRVNGLVRLGEESVGFNEGDTKAHGQTEPVSRENHVYVLARNGLIGNSGQESKSIICAPKPGLKMRLKLCGVAAVLKTVREEGLGYLRTSVF
jgi:hypothetical protein